MTFDRSRDREQQLDVVLEPIRFGGREARVLATEDFARVAHELTGSGALAQLERIAASLPPDLAATTRALAERVRLTLQ